MVTSVDHPNRKWHEFVTIPATYWVIWDMDWMAMEMNRSTKAKEATTSLCHKLTVYPKLCQQGATDMLTHFAHLNMLKAHYETGLRLLDSKHWFSPVNKHEEQGLYNGRWLAKRLS